MARAFLRQRTGVENYYTLSDMDPDEFHEATEGLGILMPLPTFPKADDAERLLKALAGVM